MMAKLTRSSGVHCRVAPTSKTTIGARRLGQTLAMAGRRTPAMAERLRRDIAISAPVLPPETTAPARPSATAWMASCMEVPPPRLKAQAGRASSGTAASTGMIS